MKHRFCQRLSLLLALAMTLTLLPAAALAEELPLWENQMVVEEDAVESPAPAEDTTEPPAEEPPSDPAPVAPSEEPAEDAGASNGDDDWDAASSEDATLYILANEAEAEANGQIVLSIELYENPGTDSASITLLKGPQAVPFSTGEKGSDLVNKILTPGSDALSMSGSFINSITISGTTYVADPTACTSWSVYKNNGEDSVGLGDYVPQDGDVYRVIFTTYDSKSYAFPELPNDSNALYWAMALTEDNTSDAHNNAVSAVQATASQTLIDAALAALTVPASAQYPILVDARTVHINRTGYPYIYTPTITLDKTSAAADDLVTITVNPAAGYQLVADSLSAGGPAVKAGEGPSFTFSMPARPVSVTAQYEMTNPGALDLNSVLFSLDENGTQPVSMTPSFQPSQLDYVVTVTDHQLPKNTSKLYSTVSFTEGSSAQMYYTLDMGNGYPSPTEGPSLTSSTAYGHKVSNIAGSYTNGLGHLIRVTSQEGLTQDYQFTVRRLPTLSALSVTDGTDEAAWNIPFSPETYYYTLTVPDKTAAITLTATPTAKKTTLTLDGKALTAGEGKSIALTDGQLSLTITLTDESGRVTNPYTLTVQTDAAAKLARVTAAAESMAAAYAAHDADWWTNSSTDWWNALAMSAYQTYAPDSTFTLSPEARQVLVNKLIDAVATAKTSATAQATTLATSINGLRALGYDPQKMVTVNKTQINAPAKLAAIPVSEASKGWYVTIAPYAVAALNQGSYNSAASEQEHVDYLLTQLSGNQTYLDSYAMILQGLSYYRNQPAVSAAIEEGLNYLSTQQTSTGGYGNPNTDAMVAILLAQVGVDPTADARFLKEGNSLVDALLSYVKDNGSMGNDYASKQGLLGLVACAQVMKTGGAYNVLDFSAKPTATPVATGTSRPTPPTPGPDQEDITVYLTLKSDTATWISRTPVTVKAGSVVYHAFVEALADKSYTYTGAENGYVTSITNAGGTTLSEFDKGPNSGWLYKVNNTLPDVDLLTYKISAGDDILWYYTTDWTKDPDAGNYSGSGTTPKKEESETPTVAPEATVDQTGAAKAEVTAKEMDAAVKQAQANKAEVIVIEPTVKGDASKVSVSLPATSLAAMAKDTDAALTVKTGLAELSLPNAALGALALDAKGPISVSAEALSTDGAPIKIEIKVGEDTVSTLKGGLNVAIPVENATSGTVLMLVTETGTKILKKSAVTGETLTALLDGSATVVVKDNSKTFSDVPADHWSAEAVTFAAAHELFQGTGGETFSPTAPMSRAMLVTVLHRLEDGAGADTALTFPDVAEGVWYTEAVAWAAGTGIVTGDGSGFDPDGSISREALATMLYRYAQAVGLDTAAEAGAVKDFTDGETVSDWAGEAMNWAVAQGLLSGKDGGRLDPSATASRAEVATILTRFIPTLLG